VWRAKFWLGKLWPATKQALSHQGYFGWFTCYRSRRQFSSKSINMKVLVETFPSHLLHRVHGWHPPGLGPGPAPHTRPATSNQHRHPPPYPTSGPFSHQTRDPLGLWYPTGDPPERRTRAARRLARRISVGGEGGGGAAAQQGMHRGKG
jgi:hypothetical protein